MVDNPFRKLGALGQSVWIDYIRRDLITRGELRRWIEEDGLSGMASNPEVFTRAVAETHIYDREIQILAAQGKGAEEIYEAVSQSDAQKAADEFLALYNKSGGRDGYVSLEVNPHLSHDAESMVEDVRRLCADINRPNILFKVPAVQEGLTAVQQLVREGINVQATLIFGLSRYRQAAEAYLSGIEARIKQGKPVQHVASAASFFVGRIDSFIDPILQNIVVQGGARGESAKKAIGQVGAACAKIAYQVFREIFESDRFKKLADRGAHVQRLLWTSPGARDPRHSGVKYVDSLIGPGTINAMPIETFNDYREEGDPQARLERGIDEAHAAMKLLKDLGVDLDRAVRQLEDEGIEESIQAFDRILDALRKETAVVLSR